MKFTQLNIVIPVYTNISSLCITLWILGCSHAVAGSTTLGPLWPTSIAEFISTPASHVHTALCLLHVCFAVGAFPPALLLSKFLHHGIILPLSLCTQPPELPACEFQMPRDLTSRADWSPAGRAVDLTYNIPGVINQHGWTISERAVQFLGLGDQWLAKGLVPLDKDAFRDDPSASIKI